MQSEFIIKLKDLITEFEKQSEVCLSKVTEDQSAVSKLAQKELKAQKRLEKQVLKDKKKAEKLAKIEAERKKQQLKAETKFAKLEFKKFKLEKRV
jgi:uncharacterized protein YpuA (DUF1002 family)